MKVYTASCDRAMIRNKTQGWCIETPTREREGGQGRADNKGEGEKGKLTSVGNEVSFY